MQRSFLSKSILVTLIVIGVLVYSLASYGKGIEIANKSNWRDYYKKRLFLNLLTVQSRTVLLKFSSTNPSIRELIELVRSGKEQIALKTLHSLAVDIDKSSPDEVIFISGLIYESLGLYPEAEGSYLRIASYYPSSSFLKKAKLRRIFMKLAKGIKTDSIPLIKEAGTEFYRIYKESQDPSEWQDALAGYAIVLYMLGSYIHAEDVFHKIEDYVQDSPTYLFFQAENYMKVGKLQKYREALQRLSEKYDEPLFLSYVLLRLGDIAILKGDEREGETYYKRLREKVGEKGGVPIPIPDHALLMGTIALSELYAKQGNDKEAIALLKLSLQALSRDRLDGEGDVKSIIDDILYNLITSAYKEKDYPEIIGIYYRNKGIIDDYRVFAIVGESLLTMGLPEEAITVYKAIKDKKETKVLVGLAKAYILSGKPKEALSILKTIKPLQAEEEKEVARALGLLGDLRLRRGEYAESLRNYSDALMWLKEPELLLKRAFVLRIMGKMDEALKSYEEVINKFSDTSFSPALAPERVKDIKAVAYLGIGDVYYFNKNWEKSLAAYSKGVDDVDDSGERSWVIYRIGELSLLMGDKDSALKAWEKVFKEDKGFLGRLAGERLKEVAVWKDLGM